MDIFWALIGFGGLVFLVLLGIAAILLILAKYDAGKL